MRHPKELNDKELRKISAVARHRIIKKFGVSRWSEWINGHDAEVTLELARQTYIAVREALEADLAGSNNG